MSVKMQNGTDGLFPGSFDPVTFGHIDILRRYAPFFKSLTVLTANALHKEYWFSLEERRAMAEEAFREFSNVKVESFEGLTADYAKRKGIKCILRGVRSPGDLSCEKDIAFNNRRLAPGVETFLVLPLPDKEFISSRLIKEIAVGGGDLSGLVPPASVRRIQEKLKNRS